MSAILTMTVLGERLVGRLPSYDELDTFAAELPGLGLIAQRNLCNRCFPDFAKFGTRKPAVAGPVSNAILRTAGHKVELVEMSEHELEDGSPFAVAWAKVQEKDAKVREVLVKKGLEAGGGEVRLLRYKRSHPAFDAMFLMREPREGAIDALLKSDENVRDYHAFCKTHCIEGEIDALEAQAPCLPKTLALWLLREAGFGVSVVVGEA